MEYLSTKEIARRADYASMVRKDADGRVSMMALIWVDRERRYFISTAYSSLDRAPYVRDLWLMMDFSK